MTADAIAAIEFPDMADRYQVRGVPRTVINDSIHVEGAVPEAMLMAQLTPIIVEPNQAADGVTPRASASASQPRRSSVSGTLDKYGFDIEDRRTVEHIHAADMEHTALATEQFDDRQANGIWTFSRSRGEDTMGPVVARRHREQLEAGRPVEYPQDIEVRKALDVGETGLVMGRDLQRADGIVLGSWTFGDVLGLRVRAFHELRWVSG